MPSIPSKPRSRYFKVRCAGLVVGMLLGAAVRLYFHYIKV